MDIDKEKRRIELYEQAMAWITQNSDAYDRFIELALQKVALGHKFGIGQITEVVRWDMSIRFNKFDFAIPNAYRRYIALQMFEDHPEIEPFCTTKQDGSSAKEHLHGKLRYEMVDDPGVVDLFEDPPVEPRKSIHVSEEDFDDLFK